MSTKKAATKTATRRSRPPTVRRRSATSRSSATPRRARRRSSRPCLPPPAPSRGPARSPRARRSAITTRSKSPSSARSRCRCARCAATASWSTCSTRPVTPTSPANCGPACAPRTRRCSSCPPADDDRPDHRLALGGVRRARHAARRRRSPSSTRRAPTTLHARRLPAGLRRGGRAGGAAALPPVGGSAEAAPDGLVGLLTRTVYDYSAGFPPRRARPPTTPRSTATSTRPATRCIEAIINNSEDETLLDRYLDGEDIGLDVLIDDLETAVARGTFYPVLPVCAATGLGLASCSKCSSGAFPSPVELDPPVALHVYGTPADVARCDPDGPLLAEIVRTTRRPVPRPAVGAAVVLRHAHCPRPRSTSPGTAASDARASRPRRRRAGRADLLPARHDAAPDRARRRRRHLRDRPARHRRDRRHHLGQGRPAAYRAVGHARCRCCRSPSRRRPGRTRTRSPRRCPADGRRPDGARRAPPRDRPARALVPRRGARRRRARAAARHRRPRRHRPAADRAARDVHRRVARARPAGQAVRRARPVRRLRRRRHAAAARLGRPVRREGGRRRGALAVHQLGGEGRTRTSSNTASTTTACRWSTCW